MGDSSQATYSAHLPIGAGGPHSAVTAEHQPSARASAGWVTGSHGALIRQSGSPFPEIPGETGTEQRSTVTPGAYVVAVAVAACGMTHGPAGLRAPAPDLDRPERRRRPEAHAERHEGGAQNPREDGRNGRGDRAAGAVQRLRRVAPRQPGQHGSPRRVGRRGCPSDRSVSSEGSRPPAPMGARLVRSAERPERGGWGPRRRGSSVRTLTATPARVSGLPARPAGFGPGRRHREARSSRKAARTAHRAARPTGSAWLTGGKGCDPERERGPGRAVSSHARPGSRPPRRELRNAPASWSNCARVSHS